MKLPTTVKVRSFPEDNYKAIFVGGKTYRFLHDPRKPLASEITYPEFYDVAINSWCAGGCDYCYVAAKETGIHYRDVLGKIEAVFGSMDENQRPFQVALGGEGEPTSHPAFREVLRKFRSLGIAPNYTTNGMHLNSEIMDATLESESGVAVSIHPHLKEHWTKALVDYGKENVRLNTHIVISNAATINFFWKMFDRYRDSVEYFVLLPYMSNRLAPYKEVDLEHLEKTMDDRMGDLEQVAFGSNLYQFLLDTGNRYNASLYEPESVSGYLILDDPIGFYEDSHGMKPHEKSHAVAQHIDEYGISLPLLGR